MSYCSGNLPADVAERFFNEDQARAELADMFTANERQEAAVIEAVSKPHEVAKFIIACDDPEPVAKLLRIAATVQAIPAGPHYDDFRRKACDDLVGAANSIWNFYAQEHS